ncbi:hypothetical protein HAX54_024615 [Datura stramonium]|uniref:J domain-containing protein n=1 Tax=Datura stramonium TaxID=4076 RepID=A0ABS8RGA4_DATST|nr:hypothetical protein [Datura stramonium]
MLLDTSIIISIKHGRQISSTATERGKFCWAIATKPGRFWWGTVAGAGKFWWGTATKADKFCWATPIEAVKFCWDTATEPGRFCCPTATETSRFWWATATNSGKFCWAIATEPSKFWWGTATEAGRFCWGAAMETGEFWWATTKFGWGTAIKAGKFWCAIATEAGSLPGKVNFALLPIMYEAEVTEFYTSLSFTDDDETVFAKKDAEIVFLKAAQSSEVPGALLDLQEENALLKSDNAALRKQLEELTQQMICDQRAADERIDKLAEEEKKLQLLKRKTAESIRLLEIQKRQKQRMEQMRETQKKDVENMNLKERIRAEVRKELSKLEMTCHDMASVLRRLGIAVGDGTSREVRVAYKIALLKFHPDRASQPS